MTDIDKDLQAWCYEQAALLRDGKFDELDLPHLIEELEAIATGQRPELRNWLEKAIYSMMTWRVFEGRRMACSYVRISEARGMIDSVIETCPKLESEVPTLFNEAYSNARRWLALDTGLDIRLLPKEAPFNFDYLMEVNLDDLEREPVHDDDPTHPRPLGKRTLESINRQRESESSRESKESNYYPPNDKLKLQ